MVAYPVVLFLHLVCLVFLAGVEAVSFRDALDLRAATESADALKALARMKKVAPWFTVGIVGILGSGIYMVNTTWGWTSPWVVVGLSGLVLLVVLGGGVESGRLRALVTELSADRLSTSARARGMLRDPIAWSSRMTIVCVTIAVMLLMTTKPDGVDATITLVCGIVAGVVTAIPFWHSAASVQ